HSVDLVHKQLRMIETEMMVSSVQG
ncbi:hypothetical protein Q604_UNBC07155G0002, partial [human gut metagenome]